MGQILTGARAGGREAELTGTRAARCHIFTPTPLSLGWLIYKLGESRQQVVSAVTANAFSRAGWSLHSVLPRLSSSVLCACLQRRGQVEAVRGRLC